MTMDIGPVGVWTRTDSFSTSEANEFAQRIEDLGYGALWIPDAFGRDPFAHASLLLNHTIKLVLATGVVNIHLREAQATVCAQRELHVGHGISGPGDGQRHGHLQLDAPGFHCREPRPSGHAP